MDTLLNYNTSVNSQILPYDWGKATPGVLEQVGREGGREGGTEFKSERRRCDSVRKRVAEVKLEIPYCNCRFKKTSTGGTSFLYSTGNS